MKNRFSVKIVGESGQGINLMGEVLSKAFLELGYYVFGYREYPSLIKGGSASYQLDISAQNINSSFKSSNVIIGLSRIALSQYLSDISDGGIIIHNVVKFQKSEAENHILKSKNASEEFIDTNSLLDKLNLNYRYANTFLVSLIWARLGFDVEILQEIFKEYFKERDDILENNLTCINLGFEEGSNQSLVEHGLDKPEKKANLEIMTGNEAIARSAIACGVRAFYAYPMTPASSILEYLANNAINTGMIVKQAEDEITAAQMTLGSMFMGTRAMTATSGGGFDLMTETISLAGMTETPFVCVLAQRPGPATGLPTWTQAGDLNLAIFAGHGEFPRCVLACSDLESCHRLTQQAFNIAEYFQIPVIVLTEKHIAESYFTKDTNFENLPIIRNLVEGKALEKLSPNDRYQFTDSGVSKRWVIGASKATFLANSDEHSEDGSVTEDASLAQQMYEKRMKKYTGLLKVIPEPTLFGKTSGEFLLIGWGSVKLSVLDAINFADKNVSYLHLEVLHPLDIAKLSNIMGRFKKYIAIEQNYLGQMSKILEMELKISFTDKWLKYDGRPFFVDEVIKYINKL
ncbi:MAG: 2-oxoacid:ferredoxin oxidoreductase subunit alpha [Candidatus Dojkabacteria bacterium]|nr:MAG: 2-oxoacid:ferredoxin oxidoreductase subunit alpha [Candidatus Dojkabacteria bacterium]